jgi:hypothetical protein
MSGGHFDARTFFGSRRTDIPRRFALENRFRRQAAPPVAAAYEKNFCAFVDNIKNFFRAYP